jgi:hypothetical protein
VLNQDGVLRCTKQGCECQRLLLDLGNLQELNVIGVLMMSLTSRAAWLLLQSQPVSSFLHRTLMCSRLVLVGKPSMCVNTDAGTRCSGSLVAMRDTLVLCPFQEKQQLC